MATVYGVNKTKMNTPNHQNIIDGNEQGARVRWVHDSYEASAVAQGSYIYLGGKVPAGAHILPGSALYHDALGSNSALAVGTSEGGVDLVASTATTSAGSISLAGTVDTFGTETSSASDVIVTVSGSGAITGTLRLHLLYAMV